MNLLNPAELYKELIEAREKKSSLALATVVATRGSTPQQPGARMLIYRDGRLSGTVGGGCVEADVVGEAQRLMREKRSELCRFDLIADPGEPEGDVCGGIMEIFIEPLIAD
jgi:xanthine/CO dehydrogenase XdhC/CoxF family maturation factor